MCLLCVFAAKIKMFKRKYTVLSKSLLGLLEEAYFVLNSYSCRLSPVRVISTYRHFFSLFV